MRRTPEDFHKNIAPRKGILQKIRKEAKALALSTDSVLLCFTCDPYQPAEVEHRLTRQTIEIFNKRKIPFQILTKSKLAARDFDLMAQAKGRCRFAMTMVFSDDSDRLHWEPNASTVDERIATIVQAKNYGLKTWVSLEPVIDPEQTLALIEQCEDIVDHWKVGKLNYHPEAKKIDWKQFRLDVTDLLEGIGADYYIKKDLQEAR